LVLNKVKNIEIFVYETTYVCIQIEAYLAASVAHAVDEEERDAH
jgi:hypothetical protein